MKKKLFLSLAVFLSLALVAFLFLPLNSLANGVFQSRANTSEDLGRAIFEAIQNHDEVSLAKQFPTAEEFNEMYPYLKDSAQNPQAGRFIALFMGAENRKAISRWMTMQTQMQGLQFAGVHGPDTVENHRGIEIWRGMKIMVKEPNGEVRDLEAIKSLMKSQDGWIAYTLLEP